MKDSLKNMFPLDGKKAYRFFWQKELKWFSLAGKYFSVKVDSP